ncbi:unnamed protein product, partial [Symbiodinium microadriaticum]
VMAKPAEKKVVQDLSAKEKDDLILGPAKKRGAARHLIADEEIEALCPRFFKKCYTHFGLVKSKKTGEKSLEISEVTRQCPNLACVLATFVKQKCESLVSSPAKSPPEFHGCVG